MNELKYDIARAGGVCAVLIGLFCLYLAADSVQDESLAKRTAKAYLGRLVDRMVEAHPNAGQFRRPQATLESLQLSDSNARVRAKIDGRVAVTLLLQKAAQSGRWSVIGVESLDRSAEHLPQESGPEKATAADGEHPVDTVLRTAFQGRDGIAIQRY